MHCMMGLHHENVSQREDHGRSFRSVERTASKFSLVMGLFQVGFHCISIFEANIRILELIVVVFYELFFDLLKNDRVPAACTQQLFRSHYGEMEEMQ